MEDGLVAQEHMNEIVVYQPDEVMRLEVRVLDESVWLTQAQIAELFGTKRPAITKHLTNIYKTGELERDGTCSILEHMGHDGVQQYRTAYYNLDAILAVGYRVNSREATQFRRWASSVLKEYLLRGYAFNARMNQLEDKVDRRLASHEKRLAAVEQGIDFVVRSALPAPEMVFFEGEFLAAHEAIRKIVKIAKRRLILIDNYIDERVLTLLAERRAGVACRIYGKNVNKRDALMPSRSIWFHFLQTNHRRTDYARYLRVLSIHPHPDETPGRRQQGWRRAYLPRTGRGCLSGYRERRHFDIIMPNFL